MFSTLFKVSTLPMRTALKALPTSVKIGGGAVIALVMVAVIYNLVKE